MSIFKIAQRALLAWAVTLAPNLGQARAIKTDMPPVFNLHPTKIFDGFCLYKPTNFGSSVVTLTVISSDLGMPALQLESGDLVADLGTNAAIFIKGKRVQGTPRTLHIEDYLQTLKSLRMQKSELIEACRRAQGTEAAMPAPRLG